jgi:hypothetical protein
MSPGKRPSGIDAFESSATAMPTAISTKPETISNRPTLMSLAPIHPRKIFTISCRLLLPVALVLFTASAFAQQSHSQLEAFAPADAIAGVSADEQSSPEDQQQTQSGVPPFDKDTKPSNEVTPNGRVIPPSQQQPKRILGIMPNYRAVSAGETPTPPTPSEAFKIAFHNSFDYSSFIFTGITSLIAEGQDAHPQLGKGVPGYWGYYWRGFVDKTDGNFLVIFALPTVFHEDERYYALGKGPIWKRAVYSASRVLITPDYHGHNTINASELLGRGIAQGISTTYYPSQDRTLSEIATKWGYALMRDALTNTFREFWPDIAVHVLHRHP